MFLKAFRVRSSSQMKGSDKKRLKADLKKKFSSLSEEELASLVPAKEEVVVTKVCTFGGDPLLVYYRSKNPLFFEREKERGDFFPTVYALWLVPSLSAATFPTWPQVLPKIANGADLMLPGVVVDREKGEKAYWGPDGKLAKGDVVGINLSSNRAHVAVGTAAHSSEDMYMSGGRGKGVTILHFYGDQLWVSGTRQELPNFPPPDGLEFLSKTKEGEEDEEGEEEEDEEEEDEAGDEVEKDASGDDSEEEQGGDSVGVLNEVSENDGELADKASGLDIAEDVGEIEEKTTGQGPETEEEPENDNRSPQEIMDDLILHSFLQTWKTTAKKIELPMLTSNFFRLHMVPQSSQPLDMKKSSYKKLSKFLARMQKEGLIQVKELQKGVESITAVNLEHEKIQSHRVVKVGKPAEEKVEDGDASDKPSYEPPFITELFAVSGATLPLFKEMGLQKGEALTAADLRDKLREYVKRENLQDQGPGVRGQVNLNPTLAQVVLGKGEADVSTLTWEELGSRLQAKMSQGYRMQFSGAAAVTASAASVMKKGKLDPIEMTVATRSGNKKVTLVHNLELYGIDPADFAHRCQTGVAASTSVGEAANRRPGATEVLVQGNQTVFISRLLLEKYRIPRKYIKGLDEGKKKKGKK